MEFLEVLKKAQELGLTKEEFLPIYLHEMEDKSVNSKRKLGPQSDCVPEPASRETREMYGFQQRQSMNPHRQLQHKPLLHTEADFQHSESSLNNSEESMCLQSPNYVDEMTTQNERLAVMQQDIKNLLENVHSNMQTILLDQQSSVSLPSDSEKLEILHSEMLHKFDELNLKLKTEFNQTHQEICAKISFHDCCKEKTIEADTYKYEELLKLHKLQLDDSFNKLQLTLNQGQFDLSLKISNMTTSIFQIFTKISEFQNIVCAELQLLKKNHQIFLANTTSVCSSVAANTNALNLLSGGIACLQNQNQVQYLKLVDLINKLQGMVHDMKVAGQFSQNAMNPDEINFFSQLLKNANLNCTSQDDSKHRSLSSDNVKFNDSNISYMSSVDSMSSDNVKFNDSNTSYMSSVDSDHASLSFMCTVNVSNFSLFLESREKCQIVQYDEKLGCCLRSGFMFPSEEEVLQVSFDMCQLDRDKIPDFLRISTEICLFSTFKEQSKWIIARENGVFNLPNIRANGWFEVCAVFLKLKSPEFVNYFEKGNISFNYTITVLNRMEKGTDENRKISCLNNHKFSSSESIVSENVDPKDMNDDDETGSHKLQPEIQTVKSILQAPSNDRLMKDMTLLIPYSYFLPIGEFSSKISSQTIIDSQDWYLPFLGQSIHAVLAFLDNNELMICVDYFHGNVGEGLPEFAIFKCRVTVIDRTDKMEDFVLGESVEMFDFMGASTPDWMENIICTIDCNAIEDKFKNKDGILLQFDFFEVE